MSNIERIKATIKDYFTLAPILFSLIGLFHIGFFFYEAYLWFDPKVGAMFWLRPVVMGMYTAFWIGTTMLRRRYAMAYLILTMVMVVFFYLGPTTPVNKFNGSFFEPIWQQIMFLHRAVADIFIEPLPANILFSFIILVFFKRMKSKNDHILDEPEIAKQD